MQEVITRHKNLVADFLAANYDLFFSQYNNTLVQSPSYVTKRQSIKLLGEILLDRVNYNVMMAYVAEGDNLKLCMKLLKNESKMVQYEGFHVFKVRRLDSVLKLCLPIQRFSSPIRTSPCRCRRFSSTTGTSC